MTMTKKLGAVLIAALLTCGFAAPRATAQNASQEELRARQAKKLESEFLSRNPWHTLLQQAKATAGEDDIIFAYITRSYEP